MTGPQKEYLGDSVYVVIDYGSVVLTTENGMGASNTIVLEPEVLRELERYVARWRAEAARKAAG